MDNICDEQNDADGFRVKKIHFAEVYGDYGVSPYNYCNELMDVYWKQDKIKIATEKEHRVIYVNDAVDCVMRVLLTKDDSITYCAEGSIYTEKEILHTIQDVVKGRIVETEEMPGSSMAVNGFKNSHAKVSFVEKYSLKEGLEQLYKLLEREKAFEVEQDEKLPIIKNRLVPLAENIGLFLVAFLVTKLFGNTWVGEHVNFYLFYVVLISVTYGINHTLVATVLVFLAKTGDLLSLGNAFDYASYIDVLQVLVVGVIAGFMRDKYKRKNSDLEDEKKYYQSELVDMTKIYDGNLYVKGLYEKRLVNYENSMARIYEIASRLDFWEPQKVIFQAVDVLKELMEMEDVAIYIAGKDSKYLRLTASSSELARTMGKSVCVDSDFFMHNELVEKIVYRNKDVSSSMPSYACGVFTQDSLTAIIMLWTNDLTKINLYQTNMLALLSRLIEAAMNRARLYWNTLTEQYMEGTNILQEEGIDNMLDLCKQGAAEEKVVYELLKVSNDTLAKDKDGVLGKVGKLVRETDYVGLKKDGLYIILMNVNDEETAFVMNRFEKADIPVEKIEE